MPHSIGDTRLRPGRNLIKGLDKLVKDDFGETDPEPIFRSLVQRDPRYRKVMEFFQRNGKLDILSAIQEVWIETAIHMVEKNKKKIRT